MLQWEQRKFTKTIPLQKDGTNVALIYAAPGFSRFNAFCAECDPDDEANNPLCFDAAVVSDDDESELDSEPEPTPAAEDASEEWPRAALLQTDFNLDGPSTGSSVGTKPQVVVDEEDVLVPQKVEAEFLRWHHRLGHASPKKIQALARMRILPGRLPRVRFRFALAVCMEKPQGVPGVLNPQATVSGRREP